MPNPVVITRPAAQAMALAQRAAAQGHDSVVFPLLDIEPLADQSTLREALVNVDTYALVAFVSPNAVDAACTLRRHWPLDVTLAVMGAGSRAALASHGVTDANASIVSPANTKRSDSQALLDTLDLAKLRGKRALIIRGETGRELLGDALMAAGMDVRAVAAYRRSIPPLNATRRQELQRLLACESNWIITSSEALRGLVALTKEMGGHDCVAALQQKRLLVPHIRIEETARELGFTCVTLTGSGDEALLAALQFSK